MVDRLRDAGKWRNLRHAPARARCSPPEELDAFLADHPPVETVVPSRRHQRHHRDRRRPGLGHQCRAVAAPVALVRRARRALRSTPPRPQPMATARPGFDDDLGAASQELRPLNLYGWSKHAFDLQVARLLAGGARRPPQWAGLKFFNVYGPNEYHKGAMISVVKVKHDEVAAGRAPRLFRSDRPDLADGEQKRDFIWVGDVVDVMLWLLDTPAVNGLFNLGTGAARSYLDLAACGLRRRRRRAAASSSSTCRRRCAGSTSPSPRPPMDRLRAAGYAGAVHRRWRTASRRYVQRLSRAARPLSLMPRSMPAMMSVLLFPQFDPVAGPARAASPIRWYALAYIAGLVLGWRLVRRLVRRAARGRDRRCRSTTSSPGPRSASCSAAGSATCCSTSRRSIFAHPLADLRGLGRRHELPRRHAGRRGRDRAVLPPRDASRCSASPTASPSCAPIGLGLGRIANFINGELWGRPAPAWLPWAMIFPQAGPVPRHPSQIYEALLEGLLLFVVHVRCWPAAHACARASAC